MSAPMMANLGFTPDSELQKVLEIAAYVGDVGQDEVNVSYTSLLIGLMWSDDATSRWLQQQQTLLGVKTPAIYGRRLINEKLTEATDLALGDTTLEQLLEQTNRAGNLQQSMYYI